MLLGYGNNVVKSHGYGVLMKVIKLLLIYMLCFVLIVYFYFRFCDIVSDEMRRVLSLVCESKLGWCSSSVCVLLHLLGRLEIC